jgi:hypothetical protein
MDPSPRFCENCGQPLFLSAKFCGTCGQPVKPLPVAQAPIPPPVEPVPPSPTQVPPAFQPQPPAPELPPYFAAAAPQPDFYPPAQSAPPAPPPPAYPQPVEAAPAPVFYNEPVCGAITGGTRQKGFLGMSSSQYTLVVTNQRIIFATLTKEISQQQVNLALEAARAQGKGLLSQWGAQLTTNVGQHYFQMAPQAILAEHPDNFFYLNSQIRSVSFSSYSDDESYRTEYTMTLDTVSGKIKLKYDLLNIPDVRALLIQTLGPIVH